MEDIEYLDEYKDLVLPGIKVGDVRQSGGARRRRISSDSSNSSSLDADIFQKLFLDKSVDDELLNLNEGTGSKSQSRRHRSPSSSDDSNDALDALFNRKLKTKPNKRRERFSSFDSVDDLGQALMRSTQRLTVPKSSTSQARARKSHNDALYRSSSSSSNSSARGKSSSRKSKPAVASSSGKGAAAAASSLTGKYKNPSKPNSVNGSSNAGKGKAVTILKAQKTDLKPPKHEPKTDPLSKYLTEFFEDSDSDSSYTYESDFFDDHDSADDDAEPIIDISTDTSRTTSVADTVTPVVSDDDGQEPQREQDEENEQNGRNERNQSSVLNSVSERLQSYLDNLSCAEAPPIYKKQSFAKKSRSSEKKPSSSEQVKHAKERSAASDKVQEEKECDQNLEPTKASGSSHSSPTKSAGRSTNSLEEKSSSSASRRLFEVDDGLTLETLQRMTQDLAEQILEIDVERSVEYQKRSGSKHRSRSRSKISGEPSTVSDLATSHVRKLTYSSERLDNGSEPLRTQLRRSKSESAFPKRGRSQRKNERKTRAATTEDNVLTSAKEGDEEVQVPVKKKRGRPRKSQINPNTLENPKSVESMLEPVAKDQKVSVETSGVDAFKKQELQEQQEAVLNSELEKAKEFAGFASQDDIRMSSCHQEKDLKSAPDRNSALDEDAARNLKKKPHPTVHTSTEAFDTAMDTSEITESVTRPQKLDNKECISPENATMAIKDLEEIENAIETAGEIAMTPELADALDASTNVQATPVAGNILEESDSQLAEDIKLAEEILAAEVGKGIEVTEAETPTVVGEQNPVIDIVKELEQETITEVVGSSEEPSSPKGQDEIEEKSPVKEKSPAKCQSPDKRRSPTKSPTKCQSPVKGQSPAKEQSSAKGQLPAMDQSPAATKEALTDTENGQRCDTPNKKSNPSSPAIFMESSVARRTLRSDKPESSHDNPETTPIKQTSRKSRGKRSLKSELTLLKDDLSRRSSPRLGRSPAESHSSQERSKLSNEKSINETKSPTVDIEPKDKIVVEASNPVKDVPMPDSTLLAEEKPSSDETDANKVDVQPLKKRGKKKKRMAKPTKELPQISKLIDEQPTTTESEQKDEPADIQAVNTSELPADQSKLSEPQVGNSAAEKIDEKPSSSRKSRSRRSRWEQVKLESNSATESSEVEREKIQLRTSGRPSSCATKGEEASPTPAKPHSSRGKGTTKKTPSKNDNAEEKESSKDRSIKRKSDMSKRGKRRKGKSVSDVRVDDSSDQNKTEAEEQLTNDSSRKMNPTTESNAVSNSSDLDPIAKESTQVKHVKENSKNIKSKGDNKPKENMNTESEEDVETVMAKSAEVNDKPAESGVKRGRIKKRRQAVSVEDSEYDQIDSPSETVPLSTIHAAAETTAKTLIKEGERNQSETPKSDTMMDTEPMPPPPPIKESEKEAVATGPKGKSRKKRRKANAPISASVKESVPITTEPTPQNPETGESAQTDATNTSSQSPSKLKDNAPEETIESNAMPNTPSTSLSCRKLRVLLKRTPTSNLMSKSKNVGRKRTKRKNFNKMLESIKEGAVSDLVDIQNKPNSESDSKPDMDVPKSDNVPCPVEEEVSKEPTEETICDVLKNVPKKAIDDVTEEVPKETAADKVTEIQENPENIPQEQEPEKPDETVSENSTGNPTTTDAPVVQDNGNETPNPSGTDEILKEDTPKKETHKEQEIHEREEANEVEKICQVEDTSKGKETPEDEETSIGVAIPLDDETLNDEETPGEESATGDLEPSGEPLTDDITDPDSLAKEIPTEEPDNAPAESPASPTPDPMETETTGVTVVAPEASTNSRVKRSMRKREADSTQPDDPLNLSTARRRFQAEAKDHPAIKRAKTDSAVPKPSERGKTISMIGNETIMTSPLNEMRSEQPQTSQAAKKAGAASKGPNYTEITKHVIIPATGKKAVDGKPPVSPTKRPLVQTLLSSTFNLRKPLPEETSASAPNLASGSGASGRKSLGKAEVEASKAKSQPTLNNSLVLTKKAVLPDSKKNESPTKDDKSAAIAQRKVNISVSLVPSKDNLANTSSLNKSLETSPALPRKVQLAETQKTSRKSEAKKKVDPKGADPKTLTVSSVDKNKPKVIPKSVLAVDNSAKKTDFAAVPTRKSIQVEISKKTETRKSEGQSLSSRKAPQKADASRKIETRKLEGTLLTRKVLLPKGSVAKEPEPEKSPEVAKTVESADAPLPEEVVTVVKGRETANKATGEQRKESSAIPRLEKPTVAVTPRTVNLVNSVHMTRAASSSRSLAPTPTPVREEQRTASKESPPLSSTQTLPAPKRSLEHIRRKKGRFARALPAPKRKAVDATEAGDPKRAKEEPQQVQESPDPESRSMAFPVKITAADLAQQMDSLSTSSKTPLVSQKQAMPNPAVQEGKHRKLRIKINRHVVTQWLKDQRAKNQALSRKAPAPADDVASDTESAVESMTGSINCPHVEPPTTVLMPPEPPLAPIQDLEVPPVVGTEAADQTILAQASVTSASVPPDPEPPGPVPPAPVLPAPVSPVPSSPGPAPPGPSPSTSVPRTLSTLPGTVSATKVVKTPVVPPLAAAKGPNETKVLENAKRLAALRNVQMHTTLPMPLPVPIAVAEVKSEPEDDPPEPMEEDFQEALPLVAAPPPVQQSLLVAEGTPPGDVSSRQVISVMSAPTPADRPAPHDIPSASAPGNNPNSFGHTKMFSFLYPNRHSGNYGEVGLDFCCPNLEGPMAAIDPTRLHAKVEAPVLEMPQFLVITTKFISKADKNIPNKVRAKLELLGKDKELSSTDQPATILDPPALPVPKPHGLPSAALPQPSLPLPSAPPIAASSSTPTPTVPASSIDSLTKQLPRGTTLTKKVLHPGAPAPPTTSDSIAASLPLSLIQLPPLLPTDQQRTELQAKVQMFDLVLQALSRRVTNLTVAERQRTIEEIVKTSTLMPIDVDVGTKLLENYVHYLNKATSSTPVPPMPSEVLIRSGISPATPIVAQLPPTVATSNTPTSSQNIVNSATPTASPQPDTRVVRKPVYDVQKNIIGFKSLTSPNVKGAVSTPRRKAAPSPASAATSSPLAASTSSAAAAASAGSRFVEMDRKTVKECQRQMINIKSPAQKPAARGSIIAIKPGSKAKAANAPVGKAASPAAIRVPAARGPANRSSAIQSPAAVSKSATRGPPPLKPIGSQGPARNVSSGTLAAPSLTRTPNPNVFIINQASHMEESILPDSNNVVAPMEAEIKGELDDSTEAII
ncbi:hypothetical protein KR038_000384 [Drosophila bunnanda]|nr:hypothetical protein KR038_000384 [Drosophila bunnanda]